jgi:tetratricopeptide (TPR) repeat protein
MKTPTRYLAMVLLLLPACASAQPAPLDRSEILGRLTQGESASYIAHLVKTRGVNFSPTADFLSGVKLAGGDGLLVERLSSSDLVPAISSSNRDRPFQHLAQCAELIHVGDDEQAQQECLAAIDENPESAWPLMATFHALKEMGGVPNQDIIALLRRAIALDPNLTSAHEALFDADPTGEEGNQETLKIMELEHAEASDDYLHPGGYTKPDELRGIPVAENISSDVQKSLQGQILSSLQQYPDLASERVRVACWYGLLGDLDKLHSEFQEAFRLEPGNPELHLALANFYQSQHNTDDELAEYREAIRIAPYREFSRATLIEALLRDNRPDEAIREWKDFLTLSPRNVPASRALVDFYLHGDDRKSAITETRRSLKASSDAIPDQAKYVLTRFDDLDRLGRLLYFNAEFDAAAEQFNLLLRFRPDSSYLHSNLGDVLRAQQHCEDASKQYREALRLQPDLFVAHHNLATCLLITHKLDDAIEQYQQMLELDYPKNYVTPAMLGTTRTMLGAAFLEKGNISDAMAQFQQVLTEQPENAKALMALGHAYYMNKDFSSAIAELKHALAIKPNPDAENELAWIYATANDPNFRNPSEALRLAKHAVQTSPQPVPAILDTLAEALLQNGQPAEAVKTEKQAASLDPKNSEIQTRLAHFQSAYSTSLVSKQ